ncbi:MAG: ABC transporter permease [Ignavibacteriaceae bacterium]
MLKNYFIVAYRNLIRNRFFTVINIAGLAAALACSILIFKWVNSEVSYDSFIKNRDSLYRVNWSFKWNGNEGVGPTTPPPLADKLVNEIPEVAAATRIYPSPNMVVRYRDKFFNEDKIFGVDSNFFSIFNFKLLEGNLNTALLLPNSVILTESESRKYFGDESSLGKIITIGDKKAEFGKMYSNIFRVTGVVQDPPENSHINFHMLTSVSSYPSVSFFNWSWIWMQVVTYAKLKNNSSTAAVESKIKEIVSKYAPAAFDRVGFSYSDLIKGGGRWDFVFQPVKDIYLGSTQIGNPLGPTGNRSYVYAFSLIGIFILLIACINFMNLSTARSEKRGREAGIRKSLGSSRSSLFLQFIIESIMFSLIALPVALLLAEIFLTPFNNLAGKSLSLNLLNPSWQIPVLLFLSVFVGFISGIYPGIYLSSFRPAKILKSDIHSGLKGKRFRNILTTFQFAVSIGLIVCTLLVQKQLTFIKDRDLGFNKENIVIISNVNNPLGNHLEAFREKIKTNPGVIDASISTGIPPNFGFGDYYKIHGKGDEQFDLISYMTDDDFIKTMGVQLKEGRNFRKDHPSDAGSVILNETAVKQFGLKDPIGKIINYPSKGNYTIIGVMKDFNFMDLHSPVLPFALFNMKSDSYRIPYSYIIVRLKGNDIASNITMLKSSWNSFTNETPFKYSFLDHNLEQQYTSEYHLGKLFLTFSIFAIFIAALGLLGLTAFITEQRTKEIGIRKVLGASVKEVVLLLSKEFTKWVLIANIIAWPAAYYIMNLWLQNFAYKTNISVWIFLASGLIALIISILTISLHTFKAANANPVKSLRYE